MNDNSVRAVVARYQPPFDPNGVYLSPLGRTCRLMPPSNPDSLREKTSYATFVYCRADTGPGQGTFADAFTLSAANFHLLRRLW